MRYSYRQLVQTKVLKKLLLSLITVDKLLARIVLRKVRSDLLTFSPKEITKN